MRCPFTTFESAPSPPARPPEGMRRNLIGRSFHDGIRNGIIVVCELIFGSVFLACLGSFFRSHKRVCEGSTFLCLLPPNSLFLFHWPLCTLVSVVPEVQQSFSNLIQQLACDFSGRGPGVKRKRGGWSHTVFKERCLSLF